MSAETKPPFDPEAEARALLNRYSETPDALCVSLDSLVADLARRAFEAGAADMRERAARECDGEGAEYRASSERCDAAGNRYGATADLHGALACEQAAARVRALPLSETR